MENTIIKEFRKETTEILPSGNKRTRVFVQFKCFNCGKVVEYEKSNFKVGKPCKECQNRLRGKTSFLKRAKKKFGDKFDLTKAEEEYFDATTPVTIKCNKHNYEYKISPTHFVAKPYPNQPAKGGCPKCTQEVQLTKNKRSIDYYLSIIEEYYPSIKVIEYGNAEHNQESILLFCPVHGEFTKTLAKVKHSTHADSYLCDKCTSEKHAWRTRMARTDIPGKVYFVKFKDVNLYKCGVTYRTTKDRLRGHIYNIDILWEIDFDTLANAYFFELQFFRTYNSLRTQHPDNTIGGYTEFFSRFINKPSQPFIEEILCRKESNSGELPPSNDEDNPERSPEMGTCND
jgi:hypothetical protein